ncbi:hypothetical protein HBI56_237540 [Parastagonospora nodorum]|nr:hypothetical protein HBH51_239610 [Parastagonospora nodorum]KAH3995177.1 hypothetical protein HBI10_178170 [Parastagonospora nodorum]KAH4010114.1 hypothetical protein HBI09_232940 [Parastagonospora nodorum]KAH4017670.1 hypothetical protein HBI13_143770 [Parastagonospora nodorum]KAH4077596.1 hypothetical protein HBH46_240820 [Parastagonospora nodorum]
MQIQTLFYTAIAIIPVALYLLLGRPWSVSSDTTTNPVPHPTSTSKVIVTVTWDDDKKTYNIGATPLANADTVASVKLVVKQARNRPRMVEVCAEGVCEKRWAVSA